jgi:chorismate-pyruvate lyase
VLPQALQTAESLTKKLRAAAKCSVTVDIISEQFILLAPELMQLLDLVEVQQGWCREVYLKVDEIIWVHAKTILPATSLESSEVESLRHIQQKPLGDFLFADPHLTRRVFVFDQTKRSSVFVFYGQAILVQETFSAVALDYFAAQS